MTWQNVTGTLVPAITVLDSISFENGLMSFKKETAYLADIAGHSANWFTGVFKITAW